tara:strand:- start:794 stop:1495 length:702 start_codon:yes stop_codon:yes gene_type:complete
MIKHVGKHNDKNVVIAFREVPGEEHMSLVIYPDNLPQIWHNKLFSCIQSTEGQAASNLADAMHKSIDADDVNLLGKCHKEKWMKKVRSQDVVLRPGKGSGARLNEINDIIRNLEAGNEAAAKMAKIDATTGLKDPANQAKGEAAADAVRASSPTATDGVLSDADIASNLIKQAETMQAQVKTLSDEITRLTEEAVTLNPGLAPKKRPGRPKKSTTLGDVSVTHDAMLSKETAS